VIREGEFYRRMRMAKLWGHVYGVVWHDINNLKLLFPPILEVTSHSNLPKGLRLLSFGRFSAGFLLEF